MHKFISLLVVTCFTMLVSKNTLAQNKLNASQFALKIKQTKDAQIVDVRTQDEFADGHIYQAKNIDWYNDDFIKNASVLNKTKPVFVYCLAGVRSAQAAQNMRNNGFTNVYELKGGIETWRKAQFPEQKNK